MDDDQGSVNGGFPRAETGNFPESKPRRPPDSAGAENTEKFTAEFPESESVKCRFSKCCFSVLNLKFDFISDGGCTREKQIQKALGSLPPSRYRCRFSESAICSSRVHPPSEIKSNFKFKTLRWRPLRWRLTLSDRGQGAFEGKAEIHGFSWEAPASKQGTERLPSFDT